MDVVLVMISLFGLRLFHRLVAWHPREEHNHMVGLSYALCGSVYAVIIALVAGSIFETMDKSEGIAAEEANSLTALDFRQFGAGAAGRRSAPRKKQPLYRRGR